MIDVIVIDPVGAEEIAERLSVSRATVHSWRSRSKQNRGQPGMPEPDIIVTKTPIWSWQRIATWAMATGRLPATGSWDDPGTAQ